MGILQPIYLLRGAYISLVPIYWVLDYLVYRHGKGCYCRSFSITVSWNVFMKLLLTFYDNTKNLWIMKTKLSARPAVDRTKGPGAKGHDERVRR